MSSTSKTQTPVAKKPFASGGGAKETHHHADANEDGVKLPPIPNKGFEYPVPPPLNAAKQSGASVRRKSTPGSTATAETNSPTWSTAGSDAPPSTGKRKTSTDSGIASPNDKKGSAKKDSIASSAGASNSTSSSTPPATGDAVSKTEANAAFRKAHPEMTTSIQTAIDAMRNEGGDFDRFDKEGQVYLDFTGGGQYGACQLQRHMEQLQRGCFGNPHSVNPTSTNSTNLVVEARADVLKFFNADPNEYICVFTSNASGALRLVGESYPFEKGSHFALLADTHNSVNGIREFAKAKGARVTYTPVNADTLRMDADQTYATLDHLSNLQLTEPSKDTEKAPPRKLFAYPAQSNFSGVKHPLDFISVAQSEGWDVLLDAAAFVPTNRLDLSVHKPEFVCMSFYKMFGYPTGHGALVMKKSMIEHMRRPWFAGGTIEVVSTKYTGRYWPAKEHENFEDGTVSYMGIPAIKIGLDFMRNELGGIDAINQRVKAFTTYLISELQHMTHTNGVHMVRIFGPANSFNRGGTVAFDLYDINDHIITDLTVEKMAMQQNISIRAGCFCNPGATEAVFGGLFTSDVSESQVPAKLTKSMVRRMASSFGAVRVSVGFSTTFGDCHTFVEFLKSTFTDRTVKDVE